MYLLHNCRTDITFETNFREILETRIVYAQTEQLSNGPFQKITRGDVKFPSFDIALENWQTAQMPPGKVQKLWKNVFQFRSPGKYYLKSLNTLGKLKFKDLPHRILFCQERPGILEGTHKSIFFHTKHPLDAFS